jgi:hypothetical protein
MLAILKHGPTTTQDVNTLVSELHTIAPGRATVPGVHECLVNGLRDTATWKLIIGPYCAALKARQPHCHTDWATKGEAFNDDQQPWSLRVMLLTSLELEAKFKEHVNTILRKAVSQVSDECDMLLTTVLTKQPHAEGFRRRSAVMTERRGANASGEVLDGDKKKRVAPELSLQASRAPLSLCLISDPLSLFVEF